MIDSHCHIVEEFYNEPGVVISNFFRNGGKYLVNMMLRESDLVEILLPKNIKGYKFGLGKHPSEIKQAITQVDKDRYVRWVKKYKPDFIGEVGLDIYWNENVNLYKYQKGWFKFFLNLSLNTNTPLSIHCRGKTDKVFWDMYQIMLEVKRERGISKFLGVMHSLETDIDLANKFIGLGMLIGINGLIYKNKKVQEIVKNISEKFILSETDSPFLYPSEKYSKKQNIPENISLIVARMNELNSNINKKVIEYNFARLEVV